MNNMTTANNLVISLPVLDWKSNKHGTSYTWAKFSNGLIENIVKRQLCKKRTDLCLVSINNKLLLTTASPFYFFDF